jgi:hypothetical protein
MSLYMFQDGGLGEVNGELNWYDKLWIGKESLIRAVFMC